MLSTGFEDGWGGIEVSDSGGGGGGRMAWELPSRAAKRGGSYGLRVQVDQAFNPAWKAKVALGSFWAVSGFEQLQVSYWARAESPDALPAPHVDVTDIDEGYAWLGYPDACELSYTEWRQCIAPVAVAASRKGHALDVSIVVGHTKGVMYIDDIQVVQQLAPPPRPPSPPPPAPPMAPTLLHETFESLEKQPWPPPEPGSEAAKPYTKLAAPVHAMLLGAPADDKDAKEGKMGTVEVPSRNNGKDGSMGARVEVKSSYKPAWRARLELGKYVVHLQKVTISFWGKAAEKNGKSVTVPIDVTDESTGGEWLGSPTQVQLTSTFSQHSVTVVIDPSRAGHYLSFSMILGGNSADYAFDEIVRSNQPAERATRWDSIHRL